MAFRFEHAMPGFSRLKSRGGIADRANIKAIPTSKSVIQSLHKSSSAPPPLRGLLSVTGFTANAFSAVKSISYLSQ